MNGDGRDEGWDDDPGEPVWDDATSWTDEDERRYQERRRAELRAARRRRLQAAFFTLVVLLVLGTGATAAGVYQGWWEWPPWEGRDEPLPTRTVVVCPTPEVTAAPVAEVTLAVLNSTSRSGLAASTAEQLQARGFTVGSIGNDSGGQIEGVAVVRHGPEGVLVARTVAAQIAGAELVDDGRAGTAVELSLGAQFTGLRPPEEAAALTEPAPVESPAGCVVPGSGTTDPPTTTPPATAPATTPAPTG